MGKRDFVDYVVQDLLAELSGVEARAMFGEHCLYLDGALFALVCDDTLYFKVGNANRARYLAAGSHQYVYLSRGKKVGMPYWEVPVDVLEDREMLAEWARESSRIMLPRSPNSKRSRTL